MMSYIRYSTLLYWDKDGEVWSHDFVPCWRRIKPAMREDRRLGLSDEIVIKRRRGRMPKFRYPKGSRHD